VLSSLRPEDGLMAIQLQNLSLAEAIFMPFDVGTICQPYIRLVIWQIICYIIKGVSQVDASDLKDCFRIKE
jgi:hypothetical protein